MTEFVTYQGTLTISRKTLDWKRSKISMLEFEVVPQSWMPYVQMGLSIAMYAAVDKAKPHTENIRDWNLAAVVNDRSSVLDCHGSVNCYQGINCCTEPGLTGALDIVYVHDFICWTYEM
jgi:hypothetical protein